MIDLGDLREKSDDELQEIASIIKYEMIRRLQPPKTLTKLALLKTPNVGPETLKCLIQTLEEHGIKVADK